MAEGEGVGAASPVRRSRRWIRGYPPLLILPLVIFVALVILPSSLNLPQSNPTTVLEYAPVPPEDVTQPSAQSGALASLGLAGTGTLTLAPEVSETVDAAAKRPLTKKCVGGRQTEDPNSPPCQPFFEGDNGGATWQGVTRDEVRVLVYDHAWTAVLSNSGSESPPPGGTYCDVDLMDCDGDGKQDPNPYKSLRVANAYSRYFNARYQTYNRHVHVYYFFADKSTAAGRRADAADNWARLKPFAVLDEAGAGGFHEEYIDSMAKRNVMVFASFTAQPESFYQKYAGKFWTFYPSVEVWSKFFVGLSCDYVRGTKVSRSRQFSGRDRAYGIVSSADRGFKSLQDFAALTKKGLQACGMYTPEKTPEVTFPYTNWGFDTEGDRTYADRNVAQLSRAGVNTILWLGGVETDMSKAMERQGYFPEIIGAGDGFFDSDALASGQSQTAWENAWTQSYQVAEGRPEDLPSYQAYKEADPDGADWDIGNSVYRDWFMLFTSIQVAGPKLSAPSVDAGLHAIQRQQSTSPFRPALYFFPGDYTFVKDAILEYYDPAATDPDGGNGCYRMVRGGIRYSFDEWPKAKGAGLDVVGYNNPNEPCNGYGDVLPLRPTGTPAPPGS